jgi:hypothetical protein
MQLQYALGEGDGSNAIPLPGIYCPIRPNPNLCKICLPTFAGKLDPGGVGATSATDVPTLSFQGLPERRGPCPRPVRS